MLFNSSIACIRSSSSIIISRLPLYKGIYKGLIGDALEYLVGPVDIL